MSNRLRTWDEIVATIPITEQTPRAWYKGMKGIAQCPCSACQYAVRLRNLSKHVRARP